MTQSLKADQRTELILNGNLYRVLIKLALPIMLANLIQTIYNLTDTYFVSKIGDDQVAAIGLVWPIIFCIITLGIGLSMGATALIAQFIGADEREHARTASGQIITYSFVISILAMITGYLITPPILRLSGATGAIYTLALEYIYIILAGLPFMFMFFSFQCIKQGEGNMVTPMIYSSISVAINIILDPLLIFTFGMGIRGAALATVIARSVIAVIAILSLFLSKKDQYAPRLKDLKPNFSMIRKISKLGLPLSLGEMSTAIGFIILNGLILDYGQSVLTAFVLGNRIVSLAVMPCMGLGRGAATVIGQNLGANKMDRVREAVRKSFVLGFAFAIISMIILIIFSSDFIALFTRNAEVLRHGIDYSTMITLALPFMAAFSVWAGVFTGAGKSKYSLIIMAGRLWVFRIPSVLIMKYIFRIDQHAIWYAIVLSNLLISLWGWGLYKWGRWNQRYAGENEAVEPDTNNQKEIPCNLSSQATTNIKS